MKLSPASLPMGPGCAGGVSGDRRESPGEALFPCSEVCGRLVPWRNFAPPRRPDTARKLAICGRSVAIQSHRNMKKSEKTVRLWGERCATRRPRRLGVVFMLSAPGPLEVRRVDFEGPSRDPGESPLRIVSLLQKCIQAPLGV